MFKRLFIALLVPILLLASCSMEATIPENTKTVSFFRDNKQLYTDSVSYLQTLDFDAMISRNDFYSVKGSEKFSGLYLQNMNNKTFSACDIKEINALFEQTDVKLIDVIRQNDLLICAFDMCIPGKNFDYGIYYTSGDRAIYFGDPSIELSARGDGFTFEQKASYGTKFTYYTEQVEDHFYYYEIT